MSLLSADLSKDFFVARMHQYLNLIVSWMSRLTEKRSKRARRKRAEARAKGETGLLSLILIKLDATELIFAVWWCPAPTKGMNYSYIQYVCYAMSFKQPA